jgi:hypothetical protein
MTSRTEGGAVKKEDGKIDIGPPPHPTDREREIALAIGRHVGGSHAAFLSETARALARYRTELQERGAREAAYALVENDLRDRRIDRITVTSNFVAAERRTLEQVQRAPALFEAIDSLGPAEQRV